MGHEGKIASVESHYKMNKEACLAWCNATEETITYEQKKSFMGYKGGTSSKRDLSAVREMMLSDRNPSNNPEAVKNKKETALMTAIKKAKDKNMEVVIINAKCKACGEVTPAMPGQELGCRNTTCKNSGTKSKIPNPNTKRKRTGKVWEHESTFSPEETEKMVEKAMKHKQAVKDRQVAYAKERRKNKRQEKEITTATANKKAKVLADPVLSKPKPKTKPKTKTMDPPTKAKKKRKQKIKTKDNDELKKKKKR